MTDASLATTAEVLPTAPPVLDDGPSIPSAHVNLALLALAVGGVAIGTTEFVTMGLLPQVAAGIGTDIPTAGHFVSSYAAGVVVGAPLIAVLFARVSRKKVLLGLMLFFAVANAASGLAHTYWQLMGARFLSGLPHGAFFGIGSVVAASLVPRERRTQAVAMMLIGLGVANVLGVPLTTVLGQSFGWQVPYVVVGGIGLLTVAAVALWIPQVPASGEESMRSELKALGRLQVWLALLIGTVGFGGMFATYAYITPTMTDLAGFSTGTIPVILGIYGIGQVGGMVLAGRIARFGILRGMIASMAMIAILLSLFGFAAHVQPLAIVFVLGLGFVPSILVPLLQTRLMDVARDGQSLAAALNHSTLNIANALGAWLGSIVLAAGYGYEWPSRVGAVLAVLGLGIAGISVVVGRRHPESV
ncbi:MFS transporter [Lapillicoccus sp.]|uniref:MFS transporter n=1 Tax=Lapillicoccus sp. TaxID=1909287 RepID=UPI0025E57D06|nr:MFS transporter [Lapillicoccus sp.]